MQMVKVKRYGSARSERGYTLLEYCAGAAIIAGVLWGALTFVGGNLDLLLRAVGTWAQTRAGEVVQD